MSFLNKFTLSGLFMVPVLAMSACGGDLTPGEQHVGQRCYSNSDCAGTLVCSAERICIPTAGLPPVVLPDQGPDMTPQPDMAPRPDMPPVPDMPDMPPQPDMPPDLPPDLCADLGEVTYCIDDFTVGFCGDGVGAFRCGEGDRCERGECVPVMEQECIVGGQDDFCIGAQSRQVCRVDEGGSSFYDVDFCDPDQFCFEGFCLSEEPICLPGGDDDFCLSDRSRQFCVVDDGRASYDVERCNDDERCQSGRCIGEDDECLPGGQNNFCLNDLTARVCVEQDGRYVYATRRCRQGTFCDGGACIDDEPSCPVGDQYCVSDTVYEICLPTNNGGGEYLPFDCPPDSRCEEGQCTQECLDRDGDGSFANCAPFDCDDGRFDVSPLLPEVCGDGLDNNCDMNVDEGCNQGGCCTGANACSGNTFCQDCACVPYNPGFCQLPNQPCTNIDAFDNGYYCLDLTGTRTGRCVGLCDYGFPDPSSTCPEPASQACVFGDPNGGAGVCFDECNTSADCQAGDEQGCFFYDLDSSPNAGVCVPKDPQTAAPLGSPCDEDDFFSCEGSAVCVDSGQGLGATCVQSCRPFKFAGQATDCQQGEHCTAFGNAFGVCVPDNGNSEFDACMAQGTTCGEDAVTCYPSPIGGNRCRRTCRISEGNADCGPMQVCNDVNQGQSEVGICAARRP